MIARCEGAHPGTQLTFTDHDGHRFQAILTDQTADTALMLERLAEALTEYAPTLQSTLEASEGRDEEPVSPRGVATKSLFVSRR